MSKQQPVNSIVLPIYTQKIHNMRMAIRKEKRSTQICPNYLKSNVSEDKNFPCWKFKKICEYQHPPLFYFDNPIPVYICTNMKKPPFEINYYVNTKDGINFTVSGSNQNYSLHKIYKTCVTGCASYIALHINDIIHTLTVIMYINKLENLLPELKILIKQILINNSVSSYVHNW
jgi:hypothetical protein